MWSAPQGRLIAHPDISLVLRNTDMSKLVQVQAAQAGGAGDAADELQGPKNIQGQEVLTASAPIAPLGWTMFVELPVEEAYASLYQALQRLAIVLLAASVFAVLAGIFLARRMVGPIQALRAGAERIGSGDFAQRISIRTGDELGRSRQPVQRHGRAAAGILCRPRKEGRTAHRRAERIAAAADRDRRRAQGHQPLDLRSAARARYAGGIGRAPV